MGSCTVLMYSKMRFYGVGVSCTDASAVVLNVENLLVPVQSRLATATISNLPASIEIDYVRVYQAVDDPKHMLG